MSFDALQPLKQTLHMIAQSLYGPWPALAEEDLHLARKGALGSFESHTSGAGSPPSAPPCRFLQTPQSQTATLRLKCMRLIHREETLSAEQAASLLRMDTARVHAQFLELKKLGLIERLGSARPGMETKTTYQLNVNHPMLEMILVPQPGSTTTSRRPRPASPA